MQCILCLEYEKQLMQINGAEGKSLKVAHIVKKHFPFLQSKVSATSCICSNCWITLSDFNGYCLDIEGKHTDSLSAVFVKCDDYEASNAVGFFNLLGEPAIKTEYDNPNESLDTDMTQNLPSIEEDAVKSEQIGVYVDPGLFEPENDQNETSVVIKKKVTKKPVKRLRHQPKALAVKVRDKATMLSRQMQSYAWGDANEDCIKQFCLLECKICSIKEFATWREMKTHHEKVHHTEGSVVCSCCSEEFKKRYKLLDHVVPKVRPDEFKCLFCGVTLKTQANLKYHMDGHDQKMINSYRFKCDKCPKSFKFMNQMESHSVTHMDKSEKRLECPKCDKKYFLEMHLKGHMRRYHNEDSHKFVKVCDVCGKTFDEQKALQRHHQLRHAAEKPVKVQCHFCEKWYLKMYILKHIRTYHTNNSLAERTCPICSMVYTTAKAARRHQKMFHEKTNSFHCTICDKHIMRKVNFDEHMAGHKNIALYQCLFCDKTFRSNANMYKHLTQAHHAEWTAKKAADRAARQR